MFIFAMNNEITSDCSASPVILLKHVHFSLKQSNQINALGTALKACAPSTINLPCLKYADCLCFKQLTFLHFPGIYEVDSRILYAVIYSSDIHCIVCVYVKLNEAVLISFHVLNFLFVFLLFLFEINLNVNQSSED